MTRATNLHRNERGAAAIEMALTLPILITMIYGIFQIGLLFEANASMQHALGEGARYATLYDNSTGNHVPTDANIQARINSKLFGKQNGTYVVAAPVTVAGYTTLSVTFTRQMNFLFFLGPNVTLSRSKKVYTVA